MAEKKNKVVFIDRLPWERQYPKIPKPGSRQALLEENQKLRKEIKTWEQLDDSSRNVGTRGGH